MRHALLLALALAVPAAAGTPVPGPVLENVLGMFAAFDIEGLGAAAAAAKAWAAGRADLDLTLQGEAGVLESGGDSYALPAPLGVYLRNNVEFFGLTDATLANPPSHAELGAYFLSPDGVALVESLVRAAVGARIAYGGQYLIPELGGDATLEDGKVVLRFAEGRPDAVVRRLNEVATADELRALMSEEPAAMKRIDENGALAQLMESVKRLEEKGVEQSRIDSMVRSSAQDWTFISAYSWLLPIEEHVAFVSKQRWAGRFLGNWHLHPPMWSKGKFLSVGGPSGADLDGAQKAGGAFVIVFEPEGFDVFNLQDLDQRQYRESDPAWIVRYRDAGWAARFAALAASLTP